MNSCSLPAVRLRAMEPEDLDMLYRIENDRVLWDVGATNVPYSRYTLHNYIANTTCDIYTDRQVRLMIENEQGQIVGIADIVNFDPKHLRAELGIVIMRSFRRRGYALSCIRQLAAYSLSQLHLHQLFVCVADNNEPSLQLFQKAGFQLSARLHDWLYDGVSFHDALLFQLPLISVFAETPNK